MSRFAQTAEALFKASDAHCHVALRVGPVREFADHCIQIIFPQHSDHRCQNVAEVEQRLEMIDSQLGFLLNSVKDSLSGTPASLAEYFTLELPNIRADLSRDAEALYEGDPAAKSVEEVVLAYPGLFAISLYRIANRLEKMNVPLIPRIVTEYAHELTGIDIHPGATIGHSFFIDHGTGIVIGETSHIGNNVKLYQGVALGALSVEKHFSNTKRHPTIQDGVIIYANATILGGETVIGHNSIIGGNVWLTESVPPNTTVYHKGEIQVRTPGDAKPK